MLRPAWDCEATAPDFRLSMYGVSLCRSEAVSKILVAVAQRVLAPGDLAA